VTGGGGGGEKVKKKQKNKQKTLFQIPNKTKKQTEKN